MDVNKILEMLEREDKPFKPQKREQVAKESLVSACNGDYDAINRLLEEDISIDERTYNKVPVINRPLKKKSSTESCNPKDFPEKVAKECDAVAIGVENPIPSPVMKRADEAVDRAIHYRGVLIEKIPEAEKPWAIDGLGETYETLEDAIAGVDYWVDHEGMDFSKNASEATAEKLSTRLLRELDKESAFAGESTTEKSPMKGTTDDIVKNKPIDFKSKNNGFETSESKETGKATAMTEQQTIKAAGEELISTKEGSIFPEDIEFDEQAFAELYDLNPDDVSAMYVEEDNNIPEHIEIRFKEGDNETLLMLMDDGSLVEEVNAEIVEEPRFSASIEQDENGNFVLLVSDAVESEDVTKSEEDGINKSEGETDSLDEDGKGRTDEFVEGAGLDLDSEYADTHDIKPAKDATTKIKDPTQLPVNK